MYWFDHNADMSLSRIRLPLGSSLSAGNFPRSLLDALIGVGLWMGAGTGLRKGTVHVELLVLLGWLAAVDGRLGREATLPVLGMYAAAADESHDGNRVGFGDCSVLAGVALTTLLCCILGDGPMKSNSIGGRLFSC
jgi:hypothetical protein